MSKKEIKEVAEPKAEETAIAVVEPSEAMLPSQSAEDLFFESQGSGLQNLGANDFSIPFLTILQKNSPQVSRANSKFIKGADQGMIMDTVTQNLYDGEKGILVIPCGSYRELVRWHQRDEGGGLVCHYSINHPAIKEFTARSDKGQPMDPKTKDVLVDTAYNFVLHLPESGFPEFAVISMSSSQLKSYRKWNTIMRKLMKKHPKTGLMYNPPTFSSVYKMTTVAQTKDQYDWFGWNIERFADVEDVSIAKIAIKFAGQISAGEVRVSAPPQDLEDETASSEDLPF